MGFVGAIQLSVLLLSCFIVFGDELDSMSWAQSPHHHLPGYPPVGAPIYIGDQPPSYHHHHPGYPPVGAPIYIGDQPPSHHHKGHPPSHHHHNGHPPSQPPSHHHMGTPPPSQPPVHPPKSSPPTHPPSYQPPVHPPKSSPPTHPPSYHLPERKLIAVQGVVYCKSCKYSGVDTLSQASPLLGAVVRLQCNNTKYPLVEESKTDKNGYFFIMAPKKVTTFASHKCKVSLVSSPLITCNKPTNLHDGLKGAILRPEKQQQLSFQLFTVGPFAFESSAKIKCPP